MLMLMLYIGLEETSEDSLYKIFFSWSLSTCTFNKVSLCTVHCVLCFVVKLSSTVDMALFSVYSPLWKHHLSFVVDYNPYAYQYAYKSHLVGAVHPLNTRKAREVAPRHHELKGSPESWKSHEDIVIPPALSECVPEI